MKKMVLVLVALVALGSLSFAQNKMTIGGNAGLYFPMGDFGEAYGTGFGILPQFEYGLNENMNIIGSIGYVSWGGESYTDPFTGLSVESSLSNIPIAVGGKYYFGTGDMKPYGMANLSMNMMTFSVEILGISGSVSETYMGLVFGGGFEKTLNEKMSLDIGGAFDMIMSEGESSNDLVIKAGIKYNLK